VPTVVLVIPYVVSGSLSSVLDGVLIEPSARLRFAAMKPPEVSSLPVTLLVLISFVGLGYALSWARAGGRAAAAGILVIWLAVSGTSYVYRITWLSVRDASLFLVPAGLVLLASVIRKDDSDSIGNVRTFALLAVFAFATLIQFPFSASIYFLYAAPLVFLAMLSLAPSWRDGDRSVLSPIAVGALFLFLAAFGVARVNQEFVGGQAQIGDGVRLAVARSGGLRVSASDARLYRRVVARIRAVGASTYIYAGPDAPELYFLADRQNPTRAEFEFFERRSTQDSELLRVLDRHDVSLVALNLRPEFSPPLGSRLRNALAARYPRHERIGRFELRWRT
jgi:hypothetical protein